MTSRADVVVLEPGAPDREFQTWRDSHREGFFARIDGRKAMLHISLCRQYESSTDSEEERGYSHTSDKKVLSESYAALRTWAEAADFEVQNCKRCRPHDSARSERVPWSELEVRLVVRDYFGMLRDELQGESVNKSAHRRELIPKLSARSPGSVERKHQNISAVLLELGLPFIDGYKPLSNYQAALHGAVLAELAATPELSETIWRVAVEPASDAPAGEVRLEETPVPVPSAAKGSSRHRGGPVKIDFAALEESNRTLGQRGEALVYDRERRRLKEEGRPDLAANVEWTVRERGDGLGFDILSFSPDGEELFIEVKTTRRGAIQPFHISPNELRVASEKGSRYRLIRVYDIDGRPRFYQLSGPLAGLELEPTGYRARVGTV